MKNKWGLLTYSKTFLSFSFMKGRSFFDVVGNFGLKKMTPNCNALAKSVISYLWVSYFIFFFSWQCKTMLFINKKGVKMGERQNRCHNDIGSDANIVVNDNGCILHALQTQAHITGWNMWSCTCAKRKDRILGRKSDSSIADCDFNAKSDLQFEMSGLPMVLWIYWGRVQFHLGITRET